MGSTPNRAIPYTDPADNLNTYPATDKASAERLDALLYDTGWVAVTVNAGYAAAAGNLPFVRRIGSVVYAKGGVDGTGLAVSTTKGGVMTIPAGFRPPATNFQRAGTNTGNAAATLFVQPTGMVDVRTNATLGTLYTFTAPWTID